MAYTVELAALDKLGEYVGSIPEKQRKAAVAALNKAADRGRTMGARNILDELNFPANYLNPSTQRLSVTKRAQGDKLEATITGRARPTSLARFVLGNPQPRNNDPIDVAVKRGKGSVRLERAFVVNLRSGNSETKGNIGLAVRTSGGQKPRAALKPKPFGNGAYLLYGLSVSQVWKRIRHEISPDVADFAAKEYDRVLKVNL